MKSGPYLDDAFSALMSTITPSSWPSPGSLDVAARHVADVSNARGVFMRAAACGMDIERWLPDGMADLEAAERGE